MQVWTLYAQTSDWDGSESADLVGVFSAPRLAIDYARKDRHNPHSQPSGPIIPDTTISDDVTFVRLNERYFMRRETVDPAPTPHACDSRCVSAVG